MTITSAQAAASVPTVPSPSAATMLMLRRTWRTLPSAQAKRVSESNAGGRLSSAAAAHQARSSGEAASATALAP
ncbi:MAG: hypothetical protein U1F25_13235 [Rubrivivax sp.]